MIGIGINENVFLANVQLDDKGVLEVTFDEGGVERPKAASVFEMLNADATVIENSYGTTIRLFPPLPPKEGNDRTEEKNVDLLVGDINKTKGIILHLLKGYYTQEDLKGKISPFKGLEQIQNDFQKQIQRKEVLEQVHRNLATDFLAMIRPQLGNREKLFRLLLVRQSKDKAFATFRGRFIDENPFYESMDIPKDASKLKFTKYEIDNGLDNATPVSKEQAADKKGEATEVVPQTAASIFGT